MRAGSATGQGANTCRVASPGISFLCLGQSIEKPIADMCQNLGLRLLDQHSVERAAINLVLPQNGPQKALRSPPVEGPLQMSSPEAFASAP